MFLSPYRHPFKTPETPARRWDPWTSSHQHRRRRRSQASVGLLTPDRIGDHLVARCMAFDAFRTRHLTKSWLPEAVGGSRLSFGSRHVLRGIDNAVNDQIQAIIAYEEERNPLNQLAQTGYIIQQIARLNRLLDVALAAYGIPEPRGRASWQAALQQERQDRMARFQTILADRTRLMEALGGEEQQLEVLTLLVYDFQKHSSDCYSDLETSVISTVCETSMRLSGLAVVTIPDWFVPGYETRQSRWQGTRVDVERLPGKSEERCIRQAAAWWGLHHPHVLKLFGACHVGESPILVRESATCVKKTADSALPSQDVLLGTAHALQFLHGRHFMHANLTLERLFATEEEHKVLLHGGELLKMSMAGNEALTRPLKKQSTMLPALPGCPDFVKHEEWGLIETMCADDAEARVGMSLVVQQLEEAGKPQCWHFWNRKTRHTSPVLSGVVAYSTEYVDPRFGITAGALVQEIAHLLDASESEAGPMDTYVFERLVSVHRQLLSLICAREVAASLMEILVRFKWSLLRRTASSNTSFCVASSRSVEHSNSWFHSEIDLLLTRCDPLKTAAASIHDWKAQCACIRETQQESFQSALDDLVDGLDDEEERVEAATLLVFEATKHRSSYDPNQLRAIERTATTIVGLPGGRERIVVPKWFIPRYEVEIGSQLNAGSFGAVHRGKWFNATVAVKCLFRCDRKLFLREATIWFTLNHPNVVKLYGACHVGKSATTRGLDDSPASRLDRRPFFVCEYASEGTLNEHLERQRSEHKTPPNVWKCLCEAARGLQHLHERGIIHGDLKGNNILVGSDHQVKLTDFGLSTFANNSSWTGGDGTIGAVRWKAPERLGGEDRGPSFESDIYSFGMCIIEAVSGKFPWQDVLDEDLVVSEVTRGQLPPRPVRFNNEQWDLVTRMCCLKPTDRVAISAVVALLSSLG
ncbi:hypothetical protein BBJ28_00000735 [Nothophytophthora sp. Chile5]|nr:hypothetical protein BBJ28_00000735 [Nothophytophthora sp. Chile5]